jgi:6-phosphogluconolactonase
MAKESLLDFVAIPVNNIFRIWGEDDPVMEAGRYAEIIRQRVPTYNGIPRLDMILLGLGEDGHTASIFPGDLHLFGSEKLIEVTEHPLTKQKRITVTGKVINNAKDIIFIVTGEPKAKMIDLIIYRNAGWEKMPASLVQPGNGELTWLLDENAAINLPVSVRRRRT